MENNDVSVKTAKEPRIESRFGYQNLSKSSSPLRTKLYVTGATISLASILIIQSPAKNETSSEILAPESSQLNNSEINFQLESYSATSENQKLKDRIKKSQSTVSVKLPGLQKIDRLRSGKIPPGTILVAKLTSGASNGTVRAEAMESLRVQGETLVEEGSVFLGTGQSTEDRLYVRFSQLVQPDGTAENIQAQAADIEDKIVGLKGSKVGRYALKYGAAIGLHFVSGLAQGLQEKETVGQQVAVKSDLKNSLLNGAGKATIEMANETMSGVRNQTPVQEVPAEKQILIIFEAIQ